MCALTVPQTIADGEPHKKVTISPIRIATHRSQLLEGQANVSEIETDPLQQAAVQHSSTGLKIKFFYRLDPTRSEAEVDYIMNKLMPSTATVLARSIRVRCFESTLILRKKKVNGGTAPSSNAG